MLFSRHTHNKQFNAGRKPLFRHHQNHNTMAVQAARQSGQNLPSAAQREPVKDPHAPNMHGISVMRILVFLGFITWLGVLWARAINPPSH
jgi:hypothetical protein